MTDGWTAAEGEGGLRIGIGIPSGEGSPHKDWQEDLE
jgi:hypothetical protein